MVVWWHFGRLERDRLAGLAKVLLWAIGGGCLEHCIEKDSEAMSSLSWKKWSDTLVAFVRGAEEGSGSLHVIYLPLLIDYVGPHMLSGGWILSWKLQGIIERFYYRSDTIGLHNRCPINACWIELTMSPTSPINHLVCQMHPNDLNPANKTCISRSEHCAKCWKH